MASNFFPKAFQIIVYAFVEMNFRALIIRSSKILKDCKYHTLLLWLPQYFGSIQVVCESPVGFDRLSYRQAEDVAV